MMVQRQSSHNPDIDVHRQPGCNTGETTGGDIGGDTEPDRSRYVCREDTTSGRSAMCYSITDVGDLHALAATVGELIRISNRDTLFGRICDGVLSLTDFSRVAFAIVDQESTLRVVTSRGIDTPIDGLRVDCGAGLGGAAVSSRMSQLVEKLHPVDSNTLEVSGAGDTESGPGTYEEFIRDEFYSAVAEPIMHGGTVIAVLYAGHHDPVSHQHSALAMLSEFAAFVAPLIVSTRRASELEFLAKAEERLRIVRHLHDTSLQHLFTIALTSQSLLAGGLPDSAVPGVRAIAQDAANASRSLRGTLTDSLDTEQGLTVAVRRLAELFSCRSGIVSDVMTVGRVHSVPRNVEQLILNSAREILHNAEKHAHASFVSIILTYRENALTLLVQDDGVGMPPGYVAEPTVAACNRIGLASVTREATISGGICEVAGNDDGGTTVRVQVPVHH